MKRFKFRLQSLKRLKEAKYEEVERTVARQHGVIEREQEKLAGLFENKKKLRVKSAEFHRELNFVMLEISRRNESAVNQLISTQELRLQEARKTLKSMQEEMAQALKEKKVFEKLEEKAREEYKKEYLADQQKKLDDFYPRNIFGEGGCES